MEFHAQMCHKFEAIASWSIPFQSINQSNKETIEHSVVSWHSSGRNNIQEPYSNSVNLTASYFIWDQISQNLRPIRKKSMRLHHESIDEKHTFQRSQSINQSINSSISPLSHQICASLKGTITSGKSYLRVNISMKFSLAQSTLWQRTRIGRHFFA